jgi:poly(3-hydroxybutyrate) depolymerase
MTRRPLIKLLKFLTIAILALMLLAVAAFRRALSGTPSPGTKSESLESGGLDRTYLIHVPASYDTKKPVPLILVLHGATQSPAGAERMSKMSQKSEQETSSSFTPAAPAACPHGIPAAAAPTP